MVSFATFARDTTAVPFTQTVRVTVVPPGFEVGILASLELRLVTNFDFDLLASRKLNGGFVTSGNSDRDLFRTSDYGRRFLGCGLGSDRRDEGKSCDSKSKT